MAAAAMTTRRIRDLGMNKNNDPGRTDL